MRRATSSSSSGVLFGEAPYGWRLSSDRSRLVLDPDEQRLLGVVRHMYFIERIPMREIVANLRKMRVVNRRGRPFGLSGGWEMIHRRHGKPPEASSRRRRAGR